jgi:hypothetical protein
MSEADFSRSPFDVVADLVATATDPTQPPERRDAACEGLKALTSQFLQQLAMDSDWRFLVTAMGREGVTGEMAGDGPWSGPIDGVDMPSDAAAPATGPLRVMRPFLASSTQDLRRLINDDFRDAPFVPPAPLLASLSPAARVAACANAVPTSAVASEAFIRGLPWAVLNHGSAILAVGDWWPEQPAMLERYWHECLTAAPNLGVPYRLARRLDGYLTNNPDRQRWFDDVVTWVESYVRNEVFEFLPSEVLTDRHLALRVGVADHMRRAEITDPMLAGSVDLLATVHVLRLAAHWDLQIAWDAGRGNPRLALAAYRERNNSGEMWFEQGLRAVLRPVPAEMLRSFSDRERQAVALTRQLRANDPALQANGLLAFPDLDTEDVMGTPEID